jgi:hypothetical protein
MATSEILIDLVHEELEDIATAIRPRTSSEYTRHAPDAGLLELVVLQVLVPILTGVISGVLTHCITSGRANKKAQDVVSQLEDIREELDGLAKAKDLDATVEGRLDTVISRLIAIRSSDPELRRAPVARDEAAVAVDCVLREFHVGPETSRAKAAGIVGRVVDAIEDAA